MNNYINNLEKQLAAKQSIINVLLANYRPYNNIVSNINSTEEEYEEGNSVNKSNENHSKSSSETTEPQQLSLTKTSQNQLVVKI